MSARKAKLGRVVARGYLRGLGADEAFERSRKRFLLRILAWIRPDLKRRLDDKARAAYQERRRKLLHAGSSAIAATARGRTTPTAQGVRLSLEVEELLKTAQELVGTGRP